jgi:hypothetical protein
MHNEANGAGLLPSGNCKLIDGALDLDEGNSGSSNPYYVGQITLGSELDSDYVPRKRISEMSADEFSRALARSPNFREEIDGPKQ